MKKIIIICAVALIAIPQITLAQDSGFGLGIIVGDPTGLSGKYWLGNNSAIDGAAAWSFGGDGALHLHADYLLHNFSLITIPKGKLPLYYGIGGRIKFSDDARVSVRIPVGLDYMLEGAPLDLFLEIVPMLDLVPDTDFSLNAGLGIRYFFGGASGGSN